MNLPRINPESMLLGIWQEQSHDFVLKNHFLQMFQRYIYLNKDNKNGLSISGLKAFIKSIENTEWHIAQERDKLEYHCKKWNPMLPLLWTHFVMIIWQQILDRSGVGYSAVTIFVPYMYLYILRAFVYVSVCVCICVGGSCLFLPMMSIFFKLFEKYVYEIKKWKKMSPAKFFAWGMRRVVKRIEQDEKISFALFTFEVQIFQLLRNFLTAKPIRFLSWVTWSFHEDQKIFTKWLPHSFVRPKRRYTSIYSQNKNYKASD